MKISSYLLIFVISHFDDSASGFQFPKPFGVTTIAATALVGSPLVAPADNQVVLPPAATAVKINIESNLDPVATAKNLFARRSQLQDAVRDFLDSVQTIRNDLDGVLPPAPDITIVAPEETEQAIKDVLAGQARFTVNGEPVYFEIDSQEGFFTFKVLSPLLPKIPFVPPTDEQRASMVIPRPPAPVIVQSPEVKSDGSMTPFWEWSFSIPVVNKEISVGEIAEVAAGIILGAYVTSYGYYVVSQALEEQQAEAKRLENQQKAEAARKAKAAEKSQAPSKLKSKEVSEVESLVMK
jgi:hypothetical protein